MEKESGQNGNNDENRSEGFIPVGIVKFPIESVSITCPICAGSGCLLCGQTGENKIEEMWADVQEMLVVQYLHDNLQKVSQLYKHLYGNMVEVKNLGTVKKDWGAIEISIGTGQLWIAWDYTGKKQIKTLYDKKEFLKWLA